MYYFRLKIHKNFPRELKFLLRVLRGTTVEEESEPFPPELVSGGGVLELVSLLLDSGGTISELASLLAGGSVESITDSLELSASFEST